MKAIELFAGAGGLGLGVARAGFSHELVVEWEANCEATLNANRRDGTASLNAWPEVRKADVRDICFKNFEDRIELVTGGPPCQPFSLGGRHKAHADLRDMFPEAVRAIRETRPKAFVFENVKGLTRTKFRDYFEYITLQMRHPYMPPEDDEDWSEHLARLQRHHTSGKNRELEYRVVTQVLNAADFGVPQKRERVFFVGFRSDLGVEWNFPKPTHSSDALLWSQRENGEYWETHGIPKTLGVRSARFDLVERRLFDAPQMKPWRTVRDALQGLPDPQLEPSDAASWKNHNFQPGAKSYPGHTGSPMDEPAKTLKAGVHGVPGGENMLRRLDGSVRYFSIRESARLQTFPDSFEFFGAWSEAMRQIGNAVPVKLAEVICKDVERTLRNSIGTSYQIH